MVTLDFCFHDEISRSCLSSIGHLAMAMDYALASDVTATVEPMLSLRPYSIAISH